MLLAGFWMHHSWVRRHLDSTLFNQVGLLIPKAHSLLNSARPTQLWAFHLLWVFTTAVIVASKQYASILKVAQIYTFSHVWAGSASEQESWSAIYINSQIEWIWQTLQKMNQPRRDDTKVFIWLFNTGKELSFL